MIPDLSKLPTEARAHRYREMASEADCYFALSAGEVREAYDSMAKQWRLMADDIDPALGGQVLARAA